MTTTVTVYSTSVVIWREAASDPPDDDIVVLMAGADGEVWPGFKIGDQWFDIDATPQDAPTHWAHIPEAPPRSLVAVGIA